MDVFDDVLPFFTVFFSVIFYFSSILQFQFACIFESIRFSSRISRILKVPKIIFFLPKHSVIFSIFSLQFRKSTILFHYRKSCFSKETLFGAHKKESRSPIRLQSAVTSLRKTEKQTNRPNRVNRSKPKKVVFCNMSEIFIKVFIQCKSRLKKGLGTFRCDLHYNWRPEFYFFCLVTKSDSDVIFVFQFV